MPNLKEDLKSSVALKGENREKKRKDKLEPAEKEVKTSASNASEKVKSNTRNAAGKLKDGAKNVTSHSSHNQEDQRASILDKEHPQNKGAKNVTSRSSHNQAELSASHLDKERPQNEGAQNVTSRSSHNQSELRASILGQEHPQNDGVNNFTSLSSNDQADQVTNKLDKEITQHLKNIMAEASNLRERGKSMWYESMEKRDKLVAKAAKKMETTGKKAEITCTKLETKAQKLLNQWECESKARLAQLEKKLKNKAGNEEELIQLAQAWVVSTRSKMEKQFVNFEASLADIDKAMNTAADEAFGSPPNTSDKK